MATATNTKSPSTINRRAAIAGGAAAASIVAMPKLATAALQTGAGTIETQLNELADQFIQAARLIDPTVKGGWICKTCDIDEQLVAGVYLERDTHPFVQKQRD